MHSPDAPLTGKALTGLPLAAPPRSILENASLFLDFDGTLVDLAPTPDAVFVSDRLTRLLSALSVRMPGQIGIISGRPVSQLQQLLGPAPLTFSGSHGAEIRWPDGTVQEPARSDGLAGSLDAMSREMSLLQQVHPGIVIERKPYGIAIHYRGAPLAEAVCRDLAESLALSTGFVLQAGKKVFELRVAGADKGSALRLLSQSAGMTGTQPIFIGDDITDEAAFAVAAELGGAGILVGPHRETAARYRLDDVDSTLEWLETTTGLTS